MELEREKIALERERLRAELEKLISRRKRKKSNFKTIKF